MTSTASRPVPAAHSALWGPTTPSIPHQGLNATMPRTLHDRPVMPADGAITAEMSGQDVLAPASPSEMPTPGAPLHGSIPLPDTPKISGHDSTRDLALSASTASARHGQGEGGLGLIIPPSVLAAPRPWYHRMTPFVRAINLFLKWSLPPGEMESVDDGVCPPSTPTDGSSDGESSSQQ